MMMWRYLLRINRESRGPAAEQLRVVRVAAFLCVCISAGLLPLFIKIHNIDLNQAYYPAAKEFLQTGRFHYTDLGFKNLPLVVVLIAPFAALDLKTAGIWFSAASIVAYVLSYLLMTHAVARTFRDTALLMFLFVCCTPFRTSLEFGQLTPVAFLLLVSAVHLSVRDRPAWSGIALSVAFLLKIPAGVPLLLPLRKHCGRALISAAAAYGAFVLISLLTFGVPLHREYWKSALAPNVGTTILAYNNQNAYAFVMRYLRAGGLFDWSPVALPRVVQWAVFMSLVAWFGYLMSRVISPVSDSPERTRAEFSLLVATSLICFPVSWDHYYLFLILPFYSVYELFLRVPSRLVPILASLAFLLVNAPTRFRTWEVWKNQFSQASVISFPFFGCILLMTVLVYQLRSTTARKTTDLIRRVSRSPRHRRYAQHGAPQEPAACQDVLR
jgi:hypothetical protein